MAQTKTKRLAIIMTIGSDFTDYETIKLPMVENCRNEDLEFKELKENWLHETWGFYGNVQSIEIGTVTKNEVKNPDKISRCDEFWDLWLFDELAIKPEIYKTPWEKTPADFVFSSRFAVDCFLGDIYSKDFAYQICDVCGRTICQQNPANGYRWQFKDNETLSCCVACYQERVLKEGINDDFDYQTIPGDFFNYPEIEQAGWILKHESILAGSGYTGYQNPDRALSLIAEEINAGHKVLVNYDSMAIGGLGGYISIYIK